MTNFIYDTRFPIFLTLSDDKFWVINEGFKTFRYFIQLWSKLDGGFHHFQQAVGLNKPSIFGMGTFCYIHDPNWIQTWFRKNFILNIKFLRNCTLINPYNLSYQLTKRVHFFLARKFQLYFYAPITQSIPSHFEHFTLNSAQSHPNPGLCHGRLTLSQHQKSPCLSEKSP